MDTLFYKPPIMFKYTKYTVFTKEEYQQKSVKYTPFDKLYKYFIYFYRDQLDPRKSVLYR